MASGQQYDSNTLPLEDPLSRERTGARYCQPDGFTCVVLVCSLLHVYLSSPNLVSAIYFGTATSTFSIQLLLQVKRLGVEIME